MENKKTVVAQETVAKATEKKATKEKKVVEKKPAFDKKAFFTEMAKAFAKNTVTDVVADTDRENSIDKPEYEYIHFYKKGTEQNIFQLYVKEKDCKFVVGLTLKEFLKQGKNYTLTDVEKKRNDEKKVVYIRVTCTHEDAIDVANTILNAYQTKISQVVEVPVKEKKAKATTKKETTKKETATKKVEKKAANK